MNAPHPRLKTPADPGPDRAPANNALHPVDAVDPPRFEREAAPRARRAPLDRGAILFGLRSIDIALGVAVALVGLSLLPGPMLDATVRSAAPFAVLPFALAYALSTAEVYQFTFARRAMAHLGRVFLSSGVALGLLTAAAFLTGFGSATFAATAGAAWLLTLAVHCHFVALIKGLTRAGRLAENVVIVGATENARKLIEQNRRDRDLNILGVFDDRLSRAPKAMGDVPVLGRLNDLLSYPDLPKVDRIIVTVTSRAEGRVKTLIDQLRHLPNRVVLLLDLDGFAPESTSLAQIANAPAAYISGAPRDARRAAVKRAADIVFGAGMMIAFAPLMALVGLLIKLDSPGPVFFRQARHGFNNEVIHIWKFRSMRPDKAAEEGRITQVQGDDPRITRIGRFIRRTSIDELPQLINVLKGEMSLVGPRPHATHMTAEDVEVHNLVSDYAHRHRVKPGLTGWAQINGSRGPAVTRQQVEERIRLDIEYINRANFWFDLYIMFMTAPCLMGDTDNVR